MDDPLSPLTAAEVRVLGALIEKQVTTPDYYPLTLNALTNACNQLTNREPVVAYEESTVVRAIDGLREKRLATLYSGAESRAAKYKHTLTDAILLTPAEVALLCVLMLRGPQTIGELRIRTERLFAFDNLPEVETALAALVGRQPQPFVTKLPRAPGTKEARYAQLLSGPIALAPATSVVSAPEPAVPVVNPEDDRFAKIEVQLAAAQRDIAELKSQLAAFRKQFE